MHSCENIGYSLSKEGEVFCFSPQTFARFDWQWPLNSSYIDVGSWFDYSKFGFTPTSDNW